ncbi:MAG: hypothetical protein KIT58_00440 [Planctomycetota bacterium]|nr:hypothetical protein [Planctomycetota bacterium]
MAFDLRRSDPLVVPPAFAARLQAGKAYTAKWNARPTSPKWLADDAKRRLGRR